MRCTSGYRGFESHRFRQTDNMELPMLFCFLQVSAVDDACNCRSFFVFSCLRHLAPQCLRLNCRRLFVFHSFRQQIPYLSHVRVPKLTYFLISSASARRFSCRTIILFYIIRHHVVFATAKISCFPMFQAVSIFVCAFFVPKSVLFKTLGHNGNCFYAESNLLSCFFDI